MKGLEDIIGLSVVHPTWAKTRPNDPKDTHHGWVFKSPNDPPVTNPIGYGKFDCAGCIPDTVNHAKSVRELYELSHDTLGKYTVPVLWDKKLKTIVCNESAIIMESFNSAFNHICKVPNLEFYPKGYLEKIKETDDWVYSNINDGVYKCGFAKSQPAYEEAFENLFKAMDRMEGILSKQRYLNGDQITSSDIRAFVTLVRFDEVYVVYFKTNKATIKDSYPNIFNYIKDIYQLPGVARSVNMKHIKMHYYTAHPDLNKYAIIPRGFTVDFMSPHDRDRFNKKSKL